MRRRRRHSCRSWRCGCCGGAPVASSRLRVRSGATGADERGRRSSPDAGAGIVRARCQQRLGRTAASLIRVPGRIPGPAPVCRRIGRGGNTGRRKGCRGGRPGRWQDGDDVAPGRATTGGMPGRLQGRAAGRGGGRVEGIRRRRAARQPGRGGSIGISISRGGNVSQKGRKGRRARSSEQARNCQRRAPAVGLISAADQGVLIFRIQGIASLIFSPFRRRQKSPKGVGRSQN